MNTQIYHKISREYEKRRQKAEENFEKKQEDLYSIIPEIKSIDEEIKMIGVRYSKTILSSGSESSSEQLLEKLDSLKLQKKQLLIQYMMPEGILDIHYQCSHCKDSGYIDNGDTTTKCSCYKQLLISFLFEQSNLKLIQNENFEYFDETLYPDKIDHSRYGINLSPRQNIMNIRKSTHDFIDCFEDSNQKNLLFTGPTGTGKTFMCNCIAYELLNRGYTVLYQTAPALFNSINEYKMRLSKEYGYDSSFYSNLFSVDLLIIDDLGTEPFSTSKYAELLSILNTRQNNNLTSPCKTIISSNYSLKQLHEHYDERTVSRIMGHFNMYRFIGEDIRSIKRLDKNHN